MKDLEKLKELVGVQMTKAIKKRYNEINSTYDFNELLENNFGHPHKLKGDLKEFFAISLTGNYRLLIKNENNIIIVRGVIDYHGDKYNWVIP